MVTGFDTNASREMSLNEISNSLTGGKRNSARRGSSPSKKAAKKAAKKSAKKPAKKASSGKKTKRAPSAWVVHVKSFAKKNKCSYKDALSNPKCGAEYRKRN